MSYLVDLNLRLLKNNFKALLTNQCLKSHLFIEMGFFFEQYSGGFTKYLVVILNNGNTWFFKIPYRVK